MSIQMRNAVVGAILSLLYVSILLAVLYEGRMQGRTRLRPRHHIHAAPNPDPTDFLPRTVAFLFTGAGTIYIYRYRTSTVYIVYMYVRLILIPIHTQLTHFTGLDTSDAQRLCACCILWYGGTDVSMLMMAVILIDTSVYSLAAPGWYVHMRFIWLVYYYCIAFVLPFHIINHVFITILKVS